MTNIDTGAPITSEATVVVIPEIDDVTAIATGDQGPPGPRGNAVLSGAVPPTPAVGVDGDMYLNTVSMVMYGPKVAGSWPSIGVQLIGPIGPVGPQGVPGPPGLPGANGSTLLHGTGAPAIAVGNNGDFYIDTAAWVMYGPKAAGAWPGTGVNVIGPTSWTTPVAWVTAHAYVVGPPASCVTQTGSCYVCAIAHTSGTFSTDLAAGKWVLLAQGSTAGISDSPSDGTTYARKNAAWVAALPLAGGTMTGPIVLAADPTISTQAATKNYVDSHALGGDAPSDSTTYARRNAAWARAVAVAGDTMTGPLVLAADPTVALGAATKQMSDAKLPLAGGTMTGAIVLAADPAANLQAATKQYVDAHAGSGGIADAPSDSTSYGRRNGAWANVLPLAGGTLTGPLIQAADPVAALGSATKQYVDNTTVSLAGDTMTGPLLLAADPIASLGAATKAYVDASAGGGGGFPSGTVLVFYQASAPTGWTAVAQNDKALRVVSAGTTGGSAGGTNAFSTVMAQTTVGNHLLTRTELPGGITSNASNTITVYFPNNWYAPIASGGFSAGAAGTASGSSPNYSGSLSYANYMQTSNAISVTSNNTGGGQHNHPITMGIQYCDVILASKN